MSDFFIVLDASIGFLVLVFIDDFYLEYRPFRLGIPIDIVLTLFCFSPLLLQKLESRPLPGSKVEGRGMDGSPSRILLDDERRNMKKLLRIMLKSFMVLTVVVVAVGVFMAYNNQAFEQDHHLAMQLAELAQFACETQRACADDDSVFGGLEAWPRKMEYRLDASGRDFILSYKGTMDPDCGYVITGGVGWRLERQMFCDSSETLEWRKADGGMEAMHLAGAANGMAWKMLRAAFPYLVQRHVSE